MKFKGIPNMYVKVTKINSPRERRMPNGFRFDSDGFYVTDNPVLIKRLKTAFEQVADDAKPDEVVKEKVEVPAKKEKELSMVELRLMAKVQGVKSGGKSRAKLMEELKF